LSASWSHRQKSRASALVAWFHGTPTAHVNRNQRSRASEYERCVVAGPPGRLQLPQVLRHRADRDAVRIAEIVRLPQVTRLDEPPGGRDHQ
jgi:hypothetical protein